MPGRFTYPFCYVPHPRVLEAARALLDSPLGQAPGLSEGKMLGVLITDKGPLYAFSGLLGGKAVVQGFVPPIFDLTAPDGYFKVREREISAMPDGPLKAAASRELQDWIFSSYKVLNGLGEEKSVKEIFALRGLIPPGGTGDCAAPKLLNHAFRCGLKPIAMGEFWAGRSPAGEVREQGRFYPSCTGKCGPLLSWMLQGVAVDPNPLDVGFTEEGAGPEIIFEDEFLIVACKPAGMLSVPGRTGAGSLLEWLRTLRGPGIESCHRLDMDTSGLMVFAKSVEVKAAMEAQFGGREVEKTYRARLVAGAKPFSRATRGTIALPLGADYYDRPRQMVDPLNGKKAVTEYEVLEFLPSGETDIRFHPLTGRTHQLRVHAAATEGLGHPIKGDRLYGAADGGRLWLHAESLEFTHPVTGERMHFERGI